jgi:outer membrane receptor protein involved in Fe transport
MVSSNASYAQETGAISGSVIGRESRTAVSNAVITVEDSSVRAVANAGGWFRIEKLPAGRVTLTVRAPGHLEIRTESIRIDAGETTAVTIELPTTANFMDRLLVTATKSEITVGDVPGQTSIIDRAAINLRGDQGLVEAISNTPGAVVSTELGIFENVMLRGMPRGDPEFTNTLLLIDGVPQTLSNNGARVVAMPIKDAGAIEIVRGPNSALYGRTAIGGAVNIRTADPTAEHEAELEITGGEFGTAIGAARGSGPVKDWGGYYVALSGAHDTGYFENKLTGDYDVGYSSFFGKLTFAPDAKGFGSFSAQRVTSNNSTPTDILLVENPSGPGFVPLTEVEPEFDRFTNLNLRGPNYKQGETRLTLNYTRQLQPSVNLVEVFGYRSVRHEFLEDADFIGGPYDLEAKTLTQYPFSQNTKEHIIYQELRAEITPQFTRAQDRLTLGGSYERNKGTGTTDFIYTDEDTFGWPLNYLNPVTPARNLWQHDISSREYTLGVSALFAQYVVEPNSRMVVVAGGRFDHLNMDNARSDGRVSEFSTSAVSPKLSATYRLRGGRAAGQPVLNLYGAYSHAFLPPRRPSSLVPADVDLNLSPEDINNYEGGLKGIGYGGRLSFSGNYFWMKESGVVLSTRQGPLFLPTNAGDLKYQGVEGEATWRFSDRLTGYANAAYYHNRFGNFVIEEEGEEEGEVIITELRGNRLPISPNIVVNWGGHFKPRPHLDVTFDVKHVGSVQANDLNTFEIDPYTLIDAALTMRFGILRFTLSAHNLTNTEYFGNAGSETADPGRPRQILLTTSIRIR